MGKRWAAWAVSVLLAFAAGWLVDCRRQPETQLPPLLPPKVVTVTEVKEIPSPPQTKIVERVKWLTEKVEVPIETVRIVREAVKDAESGDVIYRWPTARVRFEGDRYVAREGTGWKGKGLCEVNLANETTGDSQWLSIADSELDVVASSGEIVAAPPPRGRNFLQIGAGFSSEGPTYLAQIGRRIGRRTTVGAGAVLMPDDAALVATVGWEW